MRKELFVLEFNRDLYCYFSFHDSTAPVGLGLLLVQVSSSHSLRHTTLGRTRLTFKGPCIVIYSYNKTNEMH